MRFRVKSTERRRRATLGSLAILALAAVVAFPTAATASHHKKKHYRSAGYKVTYEGSGTYKKQTHDTSHTFSLTESFHWKVHYVTSLSTKPKSIVIGPLTSGTGGGTWNYKVTLSERGASVSCGGSGTLKPAFPWNIEPSGGMIRGKTEPGGSVDFLAAVVENGGPFTASGSSSGDYCSSPSQGKDAADGPWSGDAFGANIHLAKQSIGKAKLVEHVSSAKESLKNHEVPEGMTWTGTVTLKKS